MRFVEAPRSCAKPAVLQRDVGNSRRRIERTRNAQRDAEERLRLLDASLFGKYARHCQIRSAVRRVALQQRNQHLLGVVRSTLRQHRLCQCHRVHGLVTIESGGSAQMLDRVGKSFVLDKIHADAVLFRGRSSRRFAVHFRQSRVADDEHQDRNGGKRQSENKLRRRCRRWRRCLLRDRIAHNLMTPVPCGGVTRRGSTP